MYLGLDKNVICLSCVLFIGVMVLISVVGLLNNFFLVIVVNLVKVSVVIIFDYLMVLIIFLDRLCFGLLYCIEFVFSMIL